MLNKRSRGKIIERRAKRRAKRQQARDELWSLKRPDGRGVAVTDPTPYVAVLNRITEGKYLAIGRGFVVSSPIREIKKVDVAN